MSGRDVSTKEKLLTLLDDIETTTKELLETTIAPKQEKLSPAEQGALIQLIMTKNEDLKETLQLAQEQGEIEEKMHSLQQEVNRYDIEIQSLQKHLKDAETILSTAIYQAKQKLEQITKAQEHSVSSEDLIRFSHRISSTNAVAAPLNWAPGDPRRPYPTDLEMRMGFLGRLSDLPHSAPPSLLLDSMHNNNAGIGGSGNSSLPPWYPQSHSGIGYMPGATPEHVMPSGLYLHPPHTSPAVGIDPSTRNPEDVEVMSTDSSSSSSSDSQ